MPNDTAPTNRDSAVSRADAADGDVAAAQQTEGSNAATSSPLDRCDARRYFPRVPPVAGLPGSRAANAYCDHPAGHRCAHEGIVGTTAYCWRDEPISVDATRCEEPADA